MKKRTNRKTFKVDRMEIWTMGKNENIENSQKLNIQDWRDREMLKIHKKENLGNGKNGETWKINKTRKL